MRRNVKQKRRSLIGIAVFFCFLLIFTFISRKLDWQMQPAVSCVSPRPMTIEETKFITAFIQNGTIILPAIQIMEIGDIKEYRVEVQAMLPDGSTEELSWSDAPKRGKEWIFSCKQDLHSFEGKQCVLQIKLFSGTYLRVIPKECIKEEQGFFYLYILEDSKSLFYSHWVRKIPIEIRYQNEYWAVLPDTFDIETKIILDSNRQLENGKPAHKKGEKKNGW